MRKLQFPEVIPESFPAVLTPVRPSESQEQPEPFQWFKFRVMDVAGGAFRAGHSLLKRNGDGTTRCTEGTKDCERPLSHLCLLWFLSLFLLVYRSGGTAAARRRLR